MNSLNEVDIVLLVIIYKSEANSVKGMLIDEIHNKLPKLAKKTIYKHISKLAKKEYICFGVKQGRFNTYYISDQGIDLLKMYNNL